MHGEPHTWGGDKVIMCRKRRLPDWIPACAGMTATPFVIPGLTRYPVKRNVATGDTSFVPGGDRFRICPLSFVIPGLTRYPVKRSVAAGDTLLTVFLLLILLAASATTSANEILARQNYILNCQGCHLPDGSGSKGNVPKMNDFVGYFLHVPGGREFIVQVPGAAGAPISDQELADVMNWMLLNFSRNELPDPFVPYNAEEIAKLRKDPLIDMHQRREELVARIKDKLGVTEY